MTELRVDPKQLVLDCRKREVNSAPIVKNNKHPEWQFTSSAYPRKHENRERDRECFPEFW